MSRIRLQPTDNHQGREIGVYIGWEPALKTYFAQVFDGIDADGEEIMPVDLGNDPRESPTPDAAIEALRPYADIPEDLYERLLAGRHQHDMTYTNLAQPEPTHEPDQQTSNPAPGVDRQAVFPSPTVADRDLPIIRQTDRTGDRRGAATLPEQSNTRPVPVFSRPEIEGLDR